MNFRTLTAVLLFSFSIPVITRYKLFPTEGNQYWLYGILLVSFMTLALTSLFYTDRFQKARLVSFWVSLGIVFLGATTGAIYERHVVAPSWKVHDIVLQQEAAMRYLLQGKNPYKETYFGTPVELFNYDEPGNQDAVNPALYHFVMPPAYLLVPFPFYWLANRIFGYFDGRMVLVVFMVGIWWMFLRLFKKFDLAELAIVFASLSPASVHFFIEGRSDSFALFFLVASLLFLNQKRPYLASISFAFAFLSKQTMWFAAPLFLLYMFYTTPQRKTIVRSGIVFLITIGLFVGPFLVWDANAFIDSTIRYLSSGGERGYPISGYGLSMMLYQFRLINDIHEYYPFIVWQILVGGVTTMVVLRFFSKNPSIAKFFLGFAIILFSFWYTSRYFNDSHVAVIADLIALGIFKQYDDLL